MSWARFLASPLALLRKRPRAIIIGADYPEYSLYRKLHRNRQYRVLFFIDDDPWNHKTKIDKAEIRYPAELSALCENYDIDVVIYCDENKASNLPPLKCHVIRMDA